MAFSVHAEIVSDNDKVLSSLFLDITATSDGALYAVGDRGHIYHMSSGQWLSQASGTDAALTRVHESPSQQLWAVGHDGVILTKREDSWELVRENIQEQMPLFDILFLNGSEGIAIGAYGLFLRTQDGGNTWQHELHQGLLLAEDIEYLEELKEESIEEYEYELSAMLPHLNQLTHLGQGKLMLVGEAGLVALSDDRGLTWTRQETNYYGSFFDSLQIGKRLVIAGLRGHVFYSDDNGQSWQESRTNSLATINGLLSVEDDNIMALASNGVFLVSSDQGATFTTHQLEQGESALAGDVFNHQHYIVSDHGIRILNW